jgi:hypothetical protein
MELIGYILSEIVMLLFVILVALGLIVLRRKNNGQPAFTDHDRRLLFHWPARGALTPKLCFKFGIASLLFSFVGVLEILLFAPFGAAILSGTLLMTSAGIVNLTILGNG